MRAEETRRSVDTIMIHDIPIPLTHLPLLSTGISFLAMSIMALPTIVLMTSRTNRTSVPNTPHLHAHGLAM